MLCLPACLPACLVALLALHKERDGDRCAAALTEGVPGFLLPSLTRRARVAPEMEHVEAAALVREALAEPIEGRGLDEAGVGDEPHDAALPDAVAGPPDGPNVAIVEALREFGRRPRRVRLRDPRIELLVFDVRVVVVLAVLPDRVRRVPDDDADVELLLPRAPRAVVDKHARDEVVLLIELERVREADPLERLVRAAHDAVVSGLDVDRRDVVGEEHDLVRVDLLRVLPWQLLLRDEPALQEPRDERPRPGERVEDVHALTPERLAELGAE